MSDMEKFRVPGHYWLGTLYGCSLLIQTDDATIADNARCWLNKVQEDRGAAAAARTALDMAQALGSPQEDQT